MAQYTSQTGQLNIINKNELFEDIILEPLFNNSNIIINNTLKINSTHNQEGLTNQLSNTKNSNALIYLKDQSDGFFKKLFINDNSFYITPSDGENESANAKFLITSELQNEIETISNDNNDPLVFSNIYINNDGHLQWYDSNNSNIIGFRNNNGYIQFRDDYYNTWSNVSGLGSNVSLGSLNGIDFTDEAENQILVFNSDLDIVNIDFEIVNDLSPQLGGNLDMNNHNLILGSNTDGIIDNNSNIILSFDTSSTIEEYIYLTNSNLYTSNNIPTITVNGTETDIDIQIESKNDGDVILASNNTIKTESPYVTLSNLTSLSLSSGYIKESIYTITSPSTDNLSPTIIEPNDGIILINISVSDNYYISLRDGENGQKLSLIYEANVSNASVTMSFSNSSGGSRKIGTGAGLYDNIIFNNAGQGAQLVYLENLNDDRNRWQVLNTGATVS